MTDYLNWHLEKMREVPVKDDPDEAPKSGTIQAQAEERKAENKENKENQEGKEDGKEEGKEGEKKPQTPQKKKGPIGRFIEKFVTLFDNRAKRPASHKGTNYRPPEEPSPEDRIPDDADLTVAEPADTELTKAEPADAEPTKAEPANAEPADAEHTAAEPADAEPAKVEPAAEAEAYTTAEPADSANVGAGDTGSDAEPVSGVTDTDGTDVFEGGGNMEDDDFYEEKFSELGLSEAEPTRYQRECYLKYGFDSIDNRLHIDELRQYLTARGWSENALRTAREAADPETALVELEGIGHCDFCGKPLTGVSYELLSDGRIRCDECSSTAITSESEFKDLFLKVMRSMEGFYGIDYRRPITAWMTDSKTLARSQGAIFKPTDEFDARTLGYAVKRQDESLGIVVENGSPRLATIATVAHELTHIWQYINWDSAEMKRLYPDDFVRLAVYEGMAKWAEIQYLYIIGETTYARREELSQSQRDDEYGLGLRSYMEEYPFVKDGSLVRNSPFKMFPPL